MSEFFSDGVWYSTPEALDLVLVLGDVREYLEAQPILTSLWSDLGEEEVRLLDKLEP